MSNIDNDVVVKLAALSKITISEEEIETYKKQIESIFEHLDRLKEVDTEGIEPTIQIGGLHTVTRPDEIDESLLGKEDVIDGQKNDGSSIVVPRVLS